MTITTELLKPLVGTKPKAKIKAAPQSDRDPCGVDGCRCLDALQGGVPTGGQPQAHLSTGVRTNHDFLLALAVNDGETPALLEPSHDIEVRVTAGQTVTRSIAGILRPQSYFFGLIIASRGHISSEPCTASKTSCDLLPMALIRSRTYATMADASTQTTS
ncbi:hypothetical protein CSUB01_04724 [Colletotrichum sublineola]|uniref:Uncharacterized protein n=1 Tax=Colletotrichum sublineola TaxID=1173701 RepID=A0A066XAL4_COLSU|nr:hypothetical protein CSUB01_04724 [Colletotrichum sublineola]